MKTIKIISATLVLILSVNLGFTQKPKIDKINYVGFVKLSDSLNAYRTTRLINESTFNAYRKEANTIIIDTRSKKAYDEIHIKGAVHLNFSDFTEDQLKAVIPKNTTRILIYCNNNFDSKRPSLFDKSMRLALNIPTFINLYGYGYKNIYELKGYIKEEETKIPLIINE